MPFRFVCEHCGQTLRVSSRKIGKRETCPNCKQGIVVPSEREAEEQIQARAAARKAEEAANPYSEFAVYDHDTELVYEVEDEPDPGHINRDKVSIPRWTLYAQGALLGVVGLVAFAIGILVGQGTRTGPTPADRDKPIVLKGTILYETKSTQPRADDGAVVIVLPADAKAERSQKVPLPSLAPEAPLPSSASPAMLALREVRGIYARADIDGAYRVELPKRGEYLILYLSRNAPPRPTSALADPESQDKRRKDLASLGDVFEGGNEMVEQRGYELLKVKFNTDAERDVKFPKGT